MTTAGPTVKLNNGLEIPAIGLGTWQSPKDQVLEAVAHALRDAGYRHIDCAYAYGNKAAVGEGIKSPPFRNMDYIQGLGDLFEPCGGKSRRDTCESGDGLSRPSTPSLACSTQPNGEPQTILDGVRDVVRDWPLSKTWAKLESLVEKRKLRSIGVSNFSQLKLEEILGDAKIIPAANQLELHAYNPQKKLLKFMESKGIKRQAYSPSEAPTHRS